MTAPALMAFLALLPVVGAAASPGGTVRPAERAWEAFGLADRAPVLGDLVDSDCPAVTLLRLRPGTRLPPHSAPVDRTYLLLSGSVHIGIGKSLDEARMRVLPTGSFWIVPANTSTFEWFEEEAVCQVVTTRPARDCPRPEAVDIFTPDRIAWKASGNGERAVLSGDPGVPECPYVERFRLPAGSPATPPPASPSGEVVWNVLSGTLLHMTPGAEKPGAPEELPAGTVAVLPGSTEVAASSTTTVAQRQFVGTRPRVCTWRERHR